MSTTKQQNEKVEQPKSTIGTIFDIFCTVPELIYAILKLGERVILELGKILLVGIGLFLLIGFIVTFLGSL